MRKRETMRLSLLGRSGELAPPDADGVRGRVAARWLFLVVLAENAPEAVRTLYETVTPLFGDTQRFYLAPDSGLPDADDTEGEELPSAYVIAAVQEVARRRASAARAVDDALTAWGRRWRLSDPWLMDVARESAIRWARVPAAERDKGTSQGSDASDSESWGRWQPVLWPWGLVGEEARPESPDEVPRLLPGETEAEYLVRLKKGHRWTWTHGPGPWFPGSETQADYLARVKAYTKAVYHVYRHGAGWKPAPRKKALHRDLRRVVWLHVLSKTVRDVCLSEGLAYVKGDVGDRAVRRAYSKTCELLGLTPRSQLPE